MPWGAGQSEPQFRQLRNCAQSPCQAVDASIPLAPIVQSTVGNALEGKVDAAPQARDVTRIVTDPTQILICGIGEICG
jgi:hypothetical protein